MAITAQPIAYTGSGAPTATGQILAESGSDAQELAYKGFATFTLDGATTSATLQYIDGVNVLPFTPSGCVYGVCGGNATVTVNSIKDNADGGKTATVTFSGAGSNNQTLKVAVVVLK